MHDVRPKILIPFDNREAITVKEAALRAGRSPQTLREWCARYNLGRRIGGVWLISGPALAMFLEGDRMALRAYVAGDRSSPVVARYLARFGLSAREACDA